MTKRRDRNRKARRRRPKRYIIRWTSGTAEEYRAALAEQILHTITTDKETDHETLRTRGVRRRAHTQHL